MTTSPLFGLCLTLAIFQFAKMVQTKFKSPLLNPLLISSLIIILILMLTNISFDDYFIGGRMISTLIGPATVSLAIPLYKHKKTLLEHKKVIIIAIMAGIIAHGITIIGLSLILNLDFSIVASVVPKSVTTAIAADLSRNLGGIDTITICVVIITGILGAAISPLLVKVFKLKSDIAIGLALGTSAHAIGTSKAIETNETQATMATLALILTGIITVFTAPFTYQLFQMIIRSL